VNSASRDCRPTWRAAPSRSPRSRRAARSQPADGRPDRPGALAYESFVGGDHAKSFPDLWHRYDVLRGRHAAVLEGGPPAFGHVAGVDDEGALILRDERGRAHRFRAGEVTLEKG